MRLPQLPATLTRFFAQPLAFFAECPRCGQLLYAQTTRRHSRGPAGLAAEHTGWDSRTSHLECRACKLVCVAGIILWPVKPGLSHKQRTKPQDQVPGERENAQLRAMAGEGGGGVGAGWWAPRSGVAGVNAGGIKAVRPEHSNVTAKCTCRHVTAKGQDFWEPDPNCAIHQEPDARETVNEDKWPR